jgi:hypothetical protein
MVVTHGQMFQAKKDYQKEHGELLVLHLRQVTLNVFIQSLKTQMVDYFAVMMPVKHGN